MSDPVPIIKPAVKSRKENFGGLIFTNRTPILSLNVDSYMVWEAIDGNRTVSEICVHLSEEHPEKVIDESVVMDFILACKDLDLLDFR